MAKQLLENKRKMLDYIDPETYEWTKQESNKSLQSNLIYGMIIVSIAGIYLAAGYLLVNKIKS
jgi:hypothetical protein